MARSPRISASRCAYRKPRRKHNRTKACSSKNKTGVSNGIHFHYSQGGALAENVSLALRLEHTNKRKNA